MIKFYYGCMFAGKTAYLVNAFTIYSKKNMNPLVIKPAIDDREGKMSGWGFTASRLMPEKKIPVYYYNNLREELPKLKFDSLFVDEAQFLSKEDVKYLASVVDEKDTPLLAYGLKTDVNGDLFEGASAFIAIADECKEIESLCMVEGCNNKAQMHARFIDGVRDTSTESVAIEKGNVTYMSVCRKHGDIGR